MSALVPFLALQQPGAAVQAWVSQQLTAAGFRVVHTFDLQVAREAHQDCTCPHHGTAECDCQLVVLLVYRGVEEPYAVVIHSRDQMTWISLAESAARHVDQHTAKAIERAIAAHLPYPPVAREAGREARPAD